MSFWISPGNYRAPSLLFVTEITNRTIFESIHITSRPRDSLPGGVDPTHHLSELLFLDILQMKPLRFAYSVPFRFDREMVNFSVLNFVRKMLTCYTIIFARRIWLRTFSSSPFHRVMMFIYLGQSEWSQ
jgi:hypothetical protein